MDRDIFNHSDRPFPAFQISPLDAVRSTSGMNVTVPAIQPQGSRFGDFWAARDGALSAGDFDFGSSLLMVVSPLLPQPLEQRRDMHLIGLVVAGERVHHDIDAGAWAIRPDGQPVLPLVPGEPRQREFAFRAGVNIVMYALTGNYKADQVH